jgi:hypothetical protein
LQFLPDLLDGNVNMVGLVVIIVLVG